MNAGVGSRRWYILGLLFAGTAISYIDRQALAVAAPVLRDELGISNLDYAWIVFSFLLAYTVMQGVAGWLVDRLGARKGFAVLMVWWSAAAVLHAFGTGVLSFSVYRFLLGAGQAGSWAACVRTVSEWFPPQRRAVANSLWGTGVSVGSTVAVPLVAAIILASGWRMAFAITGGVGFVWAALWIAIHPRPRAPLNSPNPEGAAPGGAAEPYSSVIRSRTVWALVLARIFADPVVWFYSAWAPEFLARNARFSMAEIGRYGWIPFAAYGGGILLGGILSDRLCRQGVSILKSRLTVMGAGVLFMVLGVLAAGPFHVSVALTAISLAVFGFGLWAPNMMTLCGEIAPRGRIGSVTGLTGVGAGLGGMIFTLFTGWTLDRMGYAPVFVAAGVSPLLAFGILLYLIRRPVAVGDSPSIRRG